MKTFGPFVVPASSSAELKQNSGVRRAMESGGPSGARIALPTALLSQRVSEPREWVISLPPVMRDMNAVAPWRIKTDTALLGDSAVLRCALRWGAGAASFTTEFDYPLCGCAFGIVGDFLDLSVFVSTPPGGTVPTFAGSTPVVGAFVVQAVPSEPTPLRWMEPVQVVTGAVVKASYLVAPFARKVRLAVTGGSGSGGAGYAGAYTLSWEDASGNERWAQHVGAGPIAIEVDVPGDAVVLNWVPDTAPGTPAFVFAEWRIGFT